MDYEQGLNMARTMKQKDPEIIRAIKQVQRAHHGVVALKFSDQGKTMQIEVLDEPYDPNVRVYPG